MSHSASLIQTPLISDKWRTHPAGRVMTRPYQGRYSAASAGSPSRGHTRGLNRQIIAGDGTVRPQPAIVAEHGLTLVRSAPYK